MIVYKVDKQSQISASTQIRDMANVLSEIPNSLQILQDLLDQQGAAISSPSIDNYRTELRREITEVIEHAQEITERSQKLVAVSDQATKHLTAVEEHFSAVLQGANSPNTQTI